MKPKKMKRADVEAELLTYGHDAEFVSRQPRENLNKMLTVDRVFGAANDPDAEPAPALRTLLTGIEGTKDYIFNGHMGTGPSASERWLSCTASLGASRAFLETLTPNQQEQFAAANLAARQGSTAHAAAEIEARVILGELDSREAEVSLLELTVNPETSDESYDTEMAEYISEYTDLIQTYVDEGREVLIEQRVTAAVPLMTVDADGDPEVYELTGSVDCGVMPSVEHNVLTVDDLKYGEGVDVNVEGNPQIRIYGLGLLALLADEEGNLPDLDRIEYHIIQPRLGGIKTWSENVEDLLDWRDEVLSPALTEALGGLKSGAKFSPSESTCQWCPARGTCPALAESRVAEGAALFDAIQDAEFIDGPGSGLDTESLTDERLGTLLAQALGITKITDDLKAEAQRRLHRGSQVKGFKLVSYTPPRRWAEGADQQIPQKWNVWKPNTLLTPTQALKVLDDEDAKRIEHLIEVPDKRPIIAPEGDKRKDWTGTPPEQMFDIEEEA